jgi:hypothetical protein
VSATGSDSGASLDITKQGSVEPKCGQERGKSVVVAGGPCFASFAKGEIHNCERLGTLGAGPPLPHPNFGCLTLRGFRRVSTTDDAIRGFLSPAVRLSEFRSPAPGRAHHRHSAGRCPTPTVPVRAPDCASLGCSAQSQPPDLFHHIFLVPPSQTPNRNRAIIPRQCNIENCTRLQRRTQHPPQNHLRRLFDKYTISGQ